MKGIIIRTLVFAALCSAMILMTGCEPEPSSSAKQQRLFAAENIELKKQMADMEKRHEKDLAAKQELLNKCREEKEVLKTMADKESLKLMQDELTNMLSEEVTRLHEENKLLKAQLEESKQAETTTVN